MSFSLSGKRALTPAQLERFASIFDNASQVCLAVMVLTPIVQGIDKTNLFVIVLGAIDVATCWTGSVLLARRKDM